MAFVLSNLPIYILTSLTLQVERRSYQLATAPGTTPRPLDKCALRSILVCIARRKPELDPFSCYLFSTATAERVRADSKKGAVMLFVVLSCECRMQLSCDVRFHVVVECATHSAPRRSKPQTYKQAQTKRANAEVCAGAGTWGIPAV